MYIALNTNLNDQPRKIIRPYVILNCYTKSIIFFILKHQQYKYLGCTQLRAVQQNKTKHISSTYIIYYNNKMYN